MYAWKKEETEHARVKWCFTMYVDNAWFHTECTYVPYVKNPSYRRRHRHPRHQLYRLNYNHSLTLSPPRHLFPRISPRLFPHLFPRLCLSNMFAFACFRVFVSWPSYVLELLYLWWQRICNNSNCVLLSEYPSFAKLFHFQFFSTSVLFIPTTWFELFSICVQNCTPRSSRAYYFVAHKMGSSVVDAMIQVGNPSGCRLRHNITRALGWRPVHFWTNVTVVCAEMHTFVEKKPFSNSWQKKK